MGKNLVLPASQVVYPRVVSWDQYFFSIYINDLLDVVNNTTKLCADDTKLYSAIESQENVKLLQEDINKSSKWLDTWLLKFNKNKYKHLHLGRDFQTKYKLDNKNISNDRKERESGGNY